MEEKATGILLTVAGGFLLVGMECVNPKRGSKPHLSNVLDLVTTKAKAGPGSSLAGRNRGK